MHESFLTPGEAATLLGVHVGTIRRWTQNGQLAEVRTPGGHRRIPRTAVEKLLLERQGVPVEPPADAEVPLAEKTWGRHMLVHTHHELQVHQSDAWMQHFDAQAKAQSRDRGQRLMSLLLQYVAGSEDEEGLWDAVRELGDAYGHQMKGQGLGLSEAIRATLFFRDVLTESTAYYPHLQVTGAGQVTLMRKVNQFMNEIQIAISRVYEEPSSRRA